MSCPNWSELLAERERLESAGGRSPSGWRAAVTHLTDCSTCRASALALDPTLVFAARSPIEVSDDEVEAIRTHVRVLRRARETERATSAPRRRLARVAAAAAVVSLMILLPTHTSRHLAPVSGPTPIPGPAPIAGGTALVDGPAPLIEPLDLPLARIYQLGEEDFSVVMVVDESIDV